MTIDGRDAVTMVGWWRDTRGRVELEKRFECRRTATGCELRGNAGYFVRAAR